MKRQKQQPNLLQVREARYTGIRKISRYKKWRWACVQLAVYNVYILPMYLFFLLFFATFWEVVYKRRSHKIPRLYHGISVKVYYRRAYLDTRASLAQVH